MNIKCGKLNNGNKEKQLYFNTFIGVDEVGRGCLAGPVLAAAVFINKKEVGEYREINDSKKLSKKKRERLYNIIINKYPYSFGIVENKTIDKINILNASLLAMKKAITKLNLEANIILVDGTYKIPNLKERQETCISGDQEYYSIAAASIIAKVERDRIMTRHSSRFKNFSFYKHCGYGTKKHLEEIKMNGTSSIHRKSFNIKAC